MEDMSTPQIDWKWIIKKENSHLVNEECNKGKKKQNAYLFPTFHNKDHSVGFGRLPEFSWGL